MSEPESDQRPKPQRRLSISRQRMVEFAVVVLGVLVALGLENLIQEARYRADARDLEKAFVADIAAAVVHSLERQTVAPCLIQRLRTLSERVDPANVSFDGAEPVGGDNFVYATPQVYKVPTRLWVTASFDRALGSEAFKRIPSDRAVSYAALFAQIVSQRERNNAEWHAIETLGPLAYPQPNLDAQVRADALRQLASLDRHQALITGASDQIIERALSLRMPREEILRIIKDEEGYRQFRSARTAAFGDCVDFSAIDRLRSSTSP